MTRSHRTHSLGPTTPFVRAAIDAARAVPGFGVDVEVTLRWCVEVAQDTPPIATGRTTELWDLLAATAALDVAAGRMLEPHLDALSILQQAGAAHRADRDPRGVAAIRADASSSWGVFAAEAPGARLTARPDGDAWRLEGRKAWCSLAGFLSHALVTATLEDGRRGLFAVALSDPTVTTHAGPWHPRGLTQVVSAPVDFAGTPAVAVGDPEWYLQRPGFAWGGISVAAVWWGAALPFIDLLASAAASERADQLAFAHLGRADAALWAARAALREASALVDRAADPADAPDPRMLAARVRNIVAAAVTAVLTEADAALGPAPLVEADAYPRRVADLHLYLRQHHGERDAARLGRLLAPTGENS
ncbi:acyl-CoA dehydrogenase [Microbacterium sp. P03]|uniref:acyl-CoA dehydrogenase n=1 Tax=Microbacterium sp. P03 TaxID=3366946 RepID=UPI003745D7EE